MSSISNGVAVNLVVMMMIVCRVIPAVDAAVFTVGDASGWSIGADYSTWASDKTFAVGDSIVFNYPAGHTVDEVSANDYKTCTTGNAIASDSSGATTVTLKTAGAHYYICGVPGHCGGGMKLAVTVAAAGGTAASPTTPTSPSTTTSPATTTTLSPPIAVMAPPTDTMNEPYSSSQRMSPSVAALFAFYIFVAFKHLV
ncbi:hypothetical protein ACS0TY_025573 [Phlomoides rotata]